MNDMDFEGLCNEIFVLWPIFEDESDAIDNVEEDDFFLSHESESELQFEPRGFHDVFEFSSSSIVRGSQVAVEGEIEQLLSGFNSVPSSSLTLFLSLVKEDVQTDNVVLVLLLEFRWCEDKDMSNRSSLML
jgi:hypothetical protein